MLRQRRPKSRAGGEAKSGVVRMIAPPGRNLGCTAQYVSRIFEMLDHVEHDDNVDHSDRGQRLPRRPATANVEAAPPRKRRRRLGDLDAVHLVMRGRLDQEEAIGGADFEQPAGRNDPPRESTTRRNSARNTS